MARIKGVPVVLVSKEIIGTDPFGDPITQDITKTVDNVLITPTSSDDIVNQMTLTGKKAVYTLAIPKNDDNDWEDKEVIFFGERWKTFGKPMQGIEELIPLKWNKKVMVESYE